MPVIILDFDSTLVRVESLEILAEISLRDRDNADKDRIVKRIEEITRQSMQGKLGFAEALSERLSFLKIRREHIDELADRLPSLLSASVRRNLDFFRKNAARIFVVSGGFINYMRPALETCGLIWEQVYANRFLVDAEGRVTDYDKNNPLAKTGGKKELVRSLFLSEKGKHNKTKKIVIGDGFTDYEVRAANLADAFYVFTENVRRTKVIPLADAEVGNMEEFFTLEKISYD